MKERPLPSKEEWYYACVSGGKGEQYYCGGNDIDAVAWYSGNSGGKTQHVGQKKPNGLGIYDMSGNVYEWFEHSTGGTIGYYRGGAFSSEPVFLRASGITKQNKDHRGKGLGFRLASSPTKVKREVQPAPRHDRIDVSPAGGRTIGIDQDVLRTPVIPGGR